MVSGVIMELPTISVATHSMYGAGPLTGDELRNPYVAVTSQKLSTHCSRRTMYPAVSAIVSPIAEPVPVKAGRPDIPDKLDGVLLL